MKDFKKGFTLIEILLVIIILGIISALITGNLITSLKKGRDARRKSDIQNIQKAVELYYDDKHVYPPSLPFGSALCETPACVSGEKIYMQQIPVDPVNGNNYFYETDSTGSLYKIYSCIEDANDKFQGVSQTGYTNLSGVPVNCGGCGLCKFKVKSTNTP